MFQVQHTNLSRSEHEHSFHLTWFSLLACSFCVSRIHSFGHLVAQSKRWDFFFCWFVVRWNAENKESHCFHQNKDGPHLTQETPKEHVTARLVGRSFPALIVHVRSFWPLADIRVVIWWATCNAAAAALPSPGWCLLIYVKLDRMNLRPHSPLTTGRSSPDWLSPNRALRLVVSVSFRHHFIYITIVSEGHHRKTRWGRTLVMLNYIFDSKLPYFWRIYS